MAFDLNDFNSYDDVRHHALSSNYIIRAWDLAQLIEVTYLCHSIGDHVVSVLFDSSTILMLMNGLMTNSSCRLTELMQNKV